MSHYLLAIMKAHDAEIFAECSATRADPDRHPRRGEPGPVHAELGLPLVRTWRRGHAGTTHRPDHRSIEEPVPRTLAQEISPHPRLGGRPHDHEPSPSDRCAVLRRTRSAFQQHRPPGFAPATCRDSLFYCGANRAPARATPDTRSPTPADSHRNGLPHSGSTWQPAPVSEQFRRMPDHRRDDPLTAHRPTVAVLPARH